MAELKRGSSAIWKKGGDEVEVRVISYRPSTKEYNVALANGETQLVKPGLLAADPKARGRTTKSSSPSRSASRGRGRGGGAGGGRARSRTRSPARSSSRGRKSAPAAAEAAVKSKERGRRSEKPADDDAAANGKKKAVASSSSSAAAQEAKIAAAIAGDGKAASAAGGASRRKSMRIAAIEAEAKIAGTKRPTTTTALAATQAAGGKTAAGGAGAVRGASWLAVLASVVCAVSIPVGSVAVNMMCDKKNCTLRALSVPRRLATFYDRNAWLAYAAFAALQAVLLVLPLGRRIDGPATASGRNRYRYNGWISLLATLGALAAVERYGVPLDLIRTKFFALLTAAYLFAALLSVVVYAKTRLRPGRNTYFRGQTGTALVDWLVGRETIPRLFGSHFDVKLYAMRLSANGGAVLVAGLLYLAYGKSGGQVPPQVYVCAALNLFYVLDLLVRENDYLTTFGYLKTGAGYVCLTTHALGPFVGSVPMRFLHDRLEHKLPLPPLGPPALAAVVAVFLVGYLLFLVSNRIKNAFRRDPGSKRFADLETIPTSRGRGLIVSGPWGWVRRPNYVGDVVMVAAVAATTGFSHAVPHLALPLGLAALLLARTLDDEARLADKYGSAWARYTQRVPYRFVPKIF